MADEKPAPPFPETASGVAHPPPLHPGGDPLGHSKGEVGGERIYSGPGLGQLTAWKCPACGNENSGALAAGCSHCGSGSAQPRHVGVPPVARQQQGERIGKGVWTDPPQLVAPPSLGFDQWFTQRFGADTGADKLRNILQEAWAAAIQWMATQPPRVEIEAEPPLPTVAIPRMLVEQVIAILDSTFDLPEEQQSPELLGLISQLREILE